MPLDSLTRGLRRLLGARPHPPDPRAQRELEARLVARVRERSPARGGGGSISGVTMLPFAARLAVAGVLVAGVSVAACQMPAEVEMDMGLRVTVSMVPTAQTQDAMRALGEKLEAVAHRVEGGDGGERDVRIEVQASIVEREGEAGTPRMNLTIDMWAPGLDEVALVDAIGEVLPEASIDDVRRVEGPVRTTVAGRFAHEMFDAALDEEDVDEARRKILAQLEAEGIEGEKHVVVVEQDGKRRVEVMVRHEEHVGHTSEATP